MEEKMQVVFSFWQDYIIKYGPEEHIRIIPVDDAKSQVAKLKNDGWKFSQPIINTKTGNRVINCKK